MPAEIKKNISNPIGDVESRFGGCVPDGLPLFKGGQGRSDDEVESLSNQLAIIFLIACIVVVCMAVGNVLENRAISNHPESQLLERSEEAE